MKKNLKLKLQLEWFDKTLKTSFSEEYRSETNIILEV